MKLKIGDKVRMTPRGFKFYSNLDHAFSLSSIRGSMSEKHFEECACGLFSIHGIGTVKKFNSSGDPYIEFKYKLDGVRYFSSHYYDLKDIEKLSFMDRLIFKIQGRI